MQLITLTTDWGNKDFFAGMVKGKLHSDIPQCQVVDISHGIEPHNISDVIIVAKNACPLFPEGTIHIIDVNSFESDEFTHVLVKSKGHYYICTDNGIPYGLFEDNFDEAYRINIYQDSNFYTFAALDLYAKVASLIAQNVPLQEIGEPVEGFYRSLLIKATYTSNILNSNIIYIDSYGNAYLNISYDKFAEIRKGRKFSVLIKSISRHDGIDSISQSYADVEKGQYLITVSATGLMQMAINHASAAKLLGLKMNDKVVFEFKD